MYKTITVVEDYNYESPSKESNAFSIVFKVSNKNFNLIEAIHKAAQEFINTDEGTEIYQIRGDTFDWGDFNAYIPKEICKKYGFEIFETESEDNVNWDECLAEPELDEDEQERIEWLKDNPHGFGIFISSDMNNAEHIQTIGYLDVFASDETAAKAAEYEGIKLIYPENLPDNISTEDKYNYYLDTPENRKIIKKYLKKEYNINWTPPKETFDQNLKFETNAFCPYCGEPLYIDMNAHIICPNCYKTFNENDISKYCDDIDFEIYIPIPNNGKYNDITNFIENIVTDIQDELGFECGYCGWDTFPDGYEPYKIGFSTLDDEIASIPPRVILLGIIDKIAELTDGILVPFKKDE